MMYDQKDSYPGILYDLLSEDLFPGDSPQQLWRSMESSVGDRLFSDIMYHLCRIEFPPDIAKRHWGGVIDNQRQMEAALGRKVNLRTALCDYLLSSGEFLNTPAKVEIRAHLDELDQPLLDQVTGLKNSRFFHQTLSLEAARAEQTGQPFSILLVSVDFFHEFSKQFGQAASERALHEIAGILRSNSRQIDHLVRLNSEDFGIILPSSGREAAMFAAERHRESISRRRFGDSRLTVSIGGASFPRDASTVVDLLAMAQKALASAKRLGRDRARLSEPDGRRHNRRALALPVECRPRAAGESVIRGRSVNISRGGMLLESATPIRCGEWVKVSIVLDDTNKLTLLAKGVHIREDLNKRGLFLVGLAFEPFLPIDSPLESITSKDIEDLR